MAMRPRGGSVAPGRGARPGAVRPVYEEFRPTAEWQQDDESHILKIYLPGFMKEHMTVLTEGRNTIRVSGERLVAGNKWNRFQEDFQVPENGAMNSARAKFQGGVLYITVSKVKVDAPPPKTEPVDDTQKQPPTPQKGQDKVPPQDSAHSQAKDEKDTQPRKSPSDPTTTKQGDREHPSTPQKGQDRASPATDQKSSEPKKSSSDHEKEHDDQDGDQRGRSSSPLPGAVASHDTAKKDSSESKEKHIASERQDDVRETREDKEEETAKKTRFEKDGAKGIPELRGALTKEKYKKLAGVKGIAELNEERQVLVNMGAAMLVIVALTAYVTYNFVSAKR